MKKLLLSALAVSVMFVSCDRDENEPVKPIKGQERDQKEVFAAIKSIQDDLKAGKTSDVSVTFDGKVKSHIAVDVYHKQTKSTVEEQFTNWINDWKTNVAGTVTATQEVSGKLGKRVVDGKGFEYEQLIKKGLIGAYQFSNAISEVQKVMSKDANNEDILMNTTAYLLGSYDALDNPEGTPENEFVKYLKKVNASDNFKGIGDRMYTALKEARKNLTDTKVFSEKMLEAISIAQKVAAIRGVHYLLAGADYLESDFVKGVHEISEGLGFVYSMQFMYNHTSPRSPYVSEKDINDFFTGLNLWNKADAKIKLQAEAERLGELFGFKANDAK